MEKSSSLVRIQPDTPNLNEALAQLVERDPEKVCVTGSIPVGFTT
jgi:hypothetical protein